MQDWLSKVFDHPTAMGCLLIAAKTLVIYFFLILGLRLLGRREMGQMNLHDLVLIVVLGNAVQNAMMNNDNSLVGGLIAAAVLLIVNRLFGVLLRRSRKVEHLMVGSPVLLIHDGVIVESHMKKEGITLEELQQALREHGLISPEQVRMCVLEVDGAISVVPIEVEAMRTRRHLKALRL